MTKGWVTVARMGAVGDNLMAASVCRPLKKMGYMVEMLTAVPNHVVFYHNPSVDKVSTVDLERDMPRDDTVEGAIEWQKWHDRRSRQSETFVHLAHSCELRHCVQPQHSLFWQPPDYRREVLAGNYLETIHRLAKVPLDLGPLFYPTDAEREQAILLRQRSGRPLIGWVLTGSRIDRRYPRSTAAIARLIRELDATVLLTAAPLPAYFKMAREVADKVVEENGSDRGLILATSPDGSLSWPLRRALTQLQYCDLVVGPDTGPMWAVAFERCAKIVLLSNMPAHSVTKHWINTTTLHADPVRVPCYPCHRLHNDKSTCVPNEDDTGARCISSIPVEAIVQEARSLLRQVGEDQWRDSTSQTPTLSMAATESAIPIETARFLRASRGMK